MSYELGAGCLPVVLFTRHFDHSTALFGENANESVGALLATLVAADADLGRERSTGWEARYCTAGG